MFRSITNNVSKNLSAGGELTGDVTITGDLSVTGSSSITVNEVIQGTSTIDVDNTEALLVRKNGDAGDVFIVDTTNSNVKIPNGLLELGTADSSSGHINAFENMSFNIDTDDDDTNRFFEFSINGSSGGGTELMRLTEGGLLGIGVQPSVALHVSGDIQLDDSAPFLLFKETGSNKDMQFKLQTDGRMSLLNDNAATEVLTVLQNGSLGIGEISPDALLHLKSSTDGKPIIKIEQSGNNVNGGGLIFLTSGTANDNDDSGVIRFKGMNDAGTPEEIEYATIYVNHDDVSDGSEDATMHFRTQSGGSLGSRLVIQGSNVGIGTSSPDRPLHVSGATPLRLERGSVAEYDFNIDNLVTGDASDLTFAAVTNGTGYLFQTKDSAGSAVNALAINHDGEIGIGTTNPAKELHVAKSGEAQMLIDSHVAGGSGSSIRLRQSRNTTIGSHTVVNDNDEVGDITFQGSDGNSYESVASIRGKVDDGSISDGSIGGSLVFKTGSSNGTRLILDDNSRISLTNNDAGASNTIFGYLAGDDIASGGNYNCLFGQQAGADITTGEKNVAYGYQALFNHTDGDRNVALGYGALMALDGTESRNIGIGYFAGDSLNNNATVDNIFIGDSAGRAGAGEVIGCVGIGTGVMQSIGANNHTGTIGIGHNALGALTTGGDNVAVGYQSLDACNTGAQNTALGRSALSATDDGTSNTAIGAYAMQLGNAGTSNTAVGAQSMIDVTGSYNTAVGMQSLFDITSGVSNVAVGALALKVAHAGESSNIAIGVEAMRDVDEDSNTADSNIAIGALAMLGGTVGGDFIGNIAIGDRALDATATNGMTGTIAIGQNALTALTSGIENTAIGYNAGLALTTSRSNTILGYSAMHRATTASDYNTAIGAHAMNGAFSTADVNFCVAVGYASVQGILTSAASGTTAIGYASLANNTSGAQNTAIGYQSGQGLTTGSYNTFVGYQVADNATITGEENTAMGVTALQALTSGNRNTAIGVRAGLVMATGSENVFIGKDAGDSATACSNVIAIGHNAMQEVGTSTTVNGTIAIGESALGLLTTGAANTAVGYQALDATDDGANNTAVGYDALGANCGDNNTAVGKDAGKIITGSWNTVIGESAGNAITSGSTNTFVGVSTDGAANSNNQIAIGNGAVTDGANKGRWGNASVATNNIQTDWTVDSDIRIKKDIENSNIGLSFINALKTRTYKKRHPSEYDEKILEARYKKGGFNYDDDKDEIIKDEFDDNKVWDGLIAQEVKTVMDDLDVEFSGWSEDSNGKQGIQYSTLVVPLIKAVQELSAKVAELEKK